ncbi:MAG: alpha/beta hydrolase [Candidatus Heimdallarchaeota archaeon]|nr:alpha/beta hydrolase [Candidatus Heimdallarchaeota archaeon]
MDHGINVFAYDSRGTGESPKEGDFGAIQAAIDAQQVISTAFKEYDQLARDQGIQPGMKILQGNCVGTFAIAAMFAGGLPLSKIVDGVILISPVHSFDLPIYLKTSYFVPIWGFELARKYLAPKFIQWSTPGDDSVISRNEATKRVQNILPEVAVKQSKQIFWKENVKKYWKYINVPALILVSKNDPLVKYEHSLGPYNELKYPIWYELHAPDHLVLEYNLPLLGKLLPEFANDPIAFHHKYQHLQPEQ